MAVETGRLPQLVMVDDPGIVASIDVLEVPLGSQDALVNEMVRLTDAATDDPTFIAAAVHRGLPPDRQPLACIPGWVPRSTGYVALYGQWRADGDRHAFAGSARGRDILRRASALSTDTRIMLEWPQASLYAPALLDATGELCPNHEPCAEGLGVGPTIRSDAGIAQFFNVFDTTRTRQQALLEGTFEIMPIARKHPGYLRTALHRSLDGTRVANYGQYRHFDQINQMYVRWSTVTAFGRLLIQDVTTPSAVLSMPIRVAGFTVGTPPRLRTYTVEHVAVGSATGG